MACDRVRTTLSLLFGKHLLAFMFCGTVPRATCLKMHGLSASDGRAGRVGLTGKLKVVGPAGNLDGALESYVLQTVGEDSLGRVMLMLPTNQKHPFSE